MGLKLGGILAGVSLLAVYWFTRECCSYVPQLAIDRPFRPNEGRRPSDDATGRDWRWDIPKGGGGGGKPRPPPPGGGGGKQQGSGTTSYWDWLMKGGGLNPHNPIAGATSPFPGVAPTPTPEIVAFGRDDFRLSVA